MKMIEGASILALANNYLTFEAPKPTNISTNSEPEMQKNVTPASPAQALASIVLPVPGGPVNNAPLGIFAPIERYFSPCFKKSTNYVISFLACSMPATSANFTLMSLNPSILKLFLLEILEMIESGVNFLKMKKVIAIPRKGVIKPSASPKVFQKAQDLWSKYTFTFQNLFCWQCSSIARKLLIFPLYLNTQDELSSYLKVILNSGMSYFISSMWIYRMFSSNFSMTVDQLMLLAFKVSSVKISFSGLDFLWNMRKVTMVAARMAPKSFLRSSVVMFISTLQLYSFLFLFLFLSFSSFSSPYTFSSFSFSFSSTSSSALSGLAAFCMLQQQRCRYLRQS